MNVGKICQHDVITVRRSDDLTLAAKLMRVKHVGYLIVVEPDPAENVERPVGVLTDRDIVVAVVASGADPKTLRVGDVMAQHPLTVNESSSIGKALMEMRRIGVRRMPVVNDRRALVGVLSLDDVLDSLAGELQDVAASIRNERRIESALRP